MTEFDPAEHTVAEVLEHLQENPDDTFAVLEAERDGKNRSSLTGLLDEPADEPEEQEGEVADANTVVLQRGDNPGLIAKRHLGNGARARDVVRANPDATWAPGTTIVLPD